MRSIKKSTVTSVMVLITSSADHITGINDLTLDVVISKNGANFEVIYPNVLSIQNGWYQIDLSESDTDTLGNLVLHITATGADPTDVLFSVVDYTMEDIGLMLNELHTIQGLKSENPSTTTPTSWTAGDISISISGDGETSTTMTRT